MMTCGALLTAILTGSCAATGDLCGSLITVLPDPGFEDRWTRNEKVQVAGQNRKIKEFCK